MHGCCVAWVSSAGAEAIEVFRRCRQMLSVTLGVQPTEATQAIYRTLVDGH